jgi:hypothetical protein
MKKLRINVKRLSLTLGVLGTSAGLIGLAAWQKAPLAAFQYPDGAVLHSEVKADRMAALGGMAPPPRDEAAPMTFDPITDVGTPNNDDRDFTKARKHGPTPMMLALEPEPVDGWVLGNQTPALAQTASLQGQAPAPIVPMHNPQPAGGAATRVASAKRPAAPPRKAAPPRIQPRVDSARVEEPDPANEPAEIAEVGEAHYDNIKRVLSVPYNGVLNRDQLAIHRLADGRAYIDLPGAKPSFSGSRSENVFEGPISRWAMAAQVGPGGRPMTRVAFKLNQGTRPRLDLDGGELRITMVQPGPAVIAKPVTPIQRMATGPAAAPPVRVAAAPQAQHLPVPRLGEARYDAQAGLLRVPVSGKLDQASITLHRLGDDQAYMDITGAAPNFNGLKSGGSQGQALARWTMAGIPDAGYPLTRLFVKLSRPGEVNAHVAGAEIRLSVTEMPPAETLESLEETAPPPDAQEGTGDLGAADPVPAN